MPPPGLSRFGSPAPKKTRWYGYQLMLTDVATLALTISTESGEVFALGYLLGPVVVHGANGNGGKAVGAPLLRAGLPLAGGLIGAATADCNGGQDFCGLGEAIAGVLIGGLTALIIDYSWANKPIEVPGHIVLGRCDGAPDCKTLGYALAW